MSFVFNDLDRAVFFVLAYSDVFDFPLTADELESRLPLVWDWDFLTGKKLNSAKPKLKRNSKKIQESLEKLILAKKAKHFSFHDQIFYGLKGLKKNTKLRLSRELAHHKRHQSIIELLSLAKRMPFIKAVVLTGSSSVKNADLNDDLDFCLICQENTLWLTRLLLLIWAKLKKKRVQIDADAQNDSHQAWCFNLWLDEAGLRVFDRQFSIYQAYEILQMDWLLDKDQVQEQFMAANWQLGELLSLGSFEEKFKRNNFSTKIYYFLNYFAFLIQLLYRRLKHGQENFTLNPHQAYFNDIWRQEKIFTIIEKKLLANALL